MLTTKPKSSTQDWQALQDLHKAVCTFVNSSKGEMKRGFVFTPFPLDDMYYCSLLELQENPDLIGCNSELYAQILQQVGSYNFDTEYVYVIRVDNESALRFIVQIGPLDETKTHEIKSLKAIQQLQSDRLEIGRSQRLIEHRFRRGYYKAYNPQRWRWPLLFTLWLLASVQAKALALGFGKKI